MKINTVRKHISGKKVIHLVFMFLTGIICLILMTVFAINMSFIIKAYVSPGQVPSFAGYTPLIVQSGSMEPAIKMGDLIVMRPAQRALMESRIVEGKIIAFRSENSIVTHRITDTIIDSEGKLLFITQGDANNTADQSPVSTDQILGEYWFKLTGMGDVILFMQSPVGMLFCIVLPLGIYKLIMALIAAGRKKRM